MKIRVELTVPGELKDEAIICFLCKNFNITVSISEVSFSTDTGWAILTFEGKKEEIEKAFEYLKNKGIRFENTQEIA